MEKLLALTFSLAISFSAAAQTAAVRVAAGAYHTCAILVNGSVKCWGYNAFGELGLGDTTTRGTDAAQMGDALPAVDL